MKMSKYLWSFIVIALSCIGTVFAQSPDSIRQSIVEHIKNGGRHNLVMTDSIAMLLMPSDGGDVEESTGERRLRTYWRVQVYSDSNGERSRQEGLRKRSAIARHFSEYPIELKWDSPYWQLRVGKFKNREDANAVADEIKKTFPSYSKEIHVVRQRMKIDD